MKIAMITPGLLPVPAVKGGAVEVLIQYLIEGNEKYKHHEIDLYTVSCDGINENKYQHTNIIPIKIGKATQIKNKLGNVFYQLFKIKKWRTSFGRELVKQMKDKEYDLVVFHNNLMAYRDIYENTKHKDNLVYVCHNNVNDGDENHIIIAKLIGRTAKKILTVSEYTKRNFQKISEDADIDVLYNCIDVERYSHRITLEERKAIREKYRIDEKDFVYIYSGRVDIYKGVLELVQAFKRLHQSNVKLMIVGASWFDEANADDQYLNKLKEEAAEMKEQIVFTGFVLPEKMPVMYQTADCLVVPSIWEEPFGVVALEGMASGLPLIVTRSGGLVEFVDEECAFIVDKDRNPVQELEIAMKKMHASKENCKKMAKNGYMRVRENDCFHKNNYYRYFLDKIEDKEIE